VTVAASFQQLATSEERERVKTLERENRELREANEILRKASALPWRSSTADTSHDRAHRRSPRGVGVEPISTLYGADVEAVAVVRRLRLARGRRNRRPAPIDRRDRAGIARSAAAGGEEGRERRRRPNA
jgi:hypothetical protein